MEFQMEKEREEIRLDAWEKMILYKKIDFLFFRAEEERKEKKLQKEYELMLQMKDSQMLVILVLAKNRHK